MDFERIVKFYPVFDGRESDVSKNYGVGSVQLIMVLKGSKGAIHFTLHTRWHLPHVQNEFLSKAIGENATFIQTVFTPLPVEVGIHSPAPLYRDDTPAISSCAYLDGKPCYFDCSTTLGKEIYSILLHKGSDGVWGKLEEIYRKTFSKDTE